MKANLPSSRRVGSNPLSPAMFQGRPSRGLKHEHNRTPDFPPDAIRLTVRTVLVSIGLGMVLSFSAGRAMRPLVLTKLDGLRLPRVIAESSTRMPEIVVPEDLSIGSYTEKLFAHSATVVSQSKFAGANSCSINENGSLFLLIDNPTALLGGESSSPSAEHLLVDIENVDPGFLDSSERLAQAMVDLTAESNTKLLSYHCHRLVPAGVSCVGVAMGSHLSFHTWPKEGVITLDFFSAVDSLESLLPSTERLFGVPSTAFSDPPHSKWARQHRGYPSEADDDSNPVEVFMNSQLIGNIEREKENIISLETEYQMIHIWDVLDGRFRTRDGYLKSVANDGSYEAQNPEMFRYDRTLFLDQVMQSKTFGEAAYHEALVHPALFAVKNPRRVAIIGGGEGATLREVLKHRTVEKVVMIEIDEALVNASRLHLPELSYCGDLPEGVESCFDDPRAEIYYQDAIAWFQERFARGTKHEDRFDVIFMDALDPGSVVEFSDALYNSQDLMSVLRDALTDEGALVAQTGEAGESKYAPMTHLMRGQLVQLLRNLEEIGYEKIVAYSEAHGSFESDWSFLVAFKDFKTLHNWRRSQAEVDWEIRSRVIPTKNGGTPLRYFDGATMMSYRFPSRVVEELYCRQSPRPADCGSGHGFDPEFLHVPSSSLEVRVSGVGARAGRGVWAKEYIPQKSYIALQDSVWNMYLPSTQYKLLEDMCMKLGFPYWQTFLASYIDGYGWFFGNEEDGSTAGVDSGVMTFANHGCKGTYNIGHPSAVNEMQYLSGRGFSSLGIKDRDEVFSPFWDRHFPDLYTDSTPRREIQAGEELLDNYLALDGSYDGSRLADHVEELSLMCSGQLVGLVTEYEEETDHVAQAVK